MAEEAAGCEDEGGRMEENVQARVAGPGEEMARPLCEGGQDIRNRKKRWRAPVKRAGFAEEMTEYSGMENAWTEGNPVCMGRWVFRREATVWGMHGRRAIWCE